MVYRVKVRKRFRKLSVYLGRISAMRIYGRNEKGKKEDIEH